MATIYGDIQGIKWLEESVGEPGTAVAKITFVLGAYTAASDNGQLGGNASAKRNGVSTGTDTLATILQKDRRDGKTVALSTISTSVAICDEPGKQATTKFYINTPAVSGGNMTFNVSDVSGSEIDAASGIQDRPVSILVLCLLS